MKRLAIFDLDGTLLDSIADIAKACNTVLAEAGLPIHPTAAYGSMVGGGLKVLMDRCMAPELQGSELYRQVTKRYTEQYSYVCKHDSHLFAGVPEMLEKLQEAGFVLAVATNKPHDMTLDILASTLRPGLVEIVYGQQPDIPAKPDPTVVQRILQETGCTAADTVYIGDSDVDIFTAKNAAVRSIGVTWGFRPRKELEDAGADSIADTIEELTQQILATCPA